MRPRALANPAFVAAMAVMTTAAIGMQAAIKYYNYYLQKLAVYPEEGRLLRSIPAETENWIRVGSDHIEEAETLKMLGTENYITRLYAQKHPRPGEAPKSLQLHAAYYTGMIDTVPHVPERCFVGAGLTLSGSAALVDLPLDTSNWLASPDIEAGDDRRLYTTRLSNDYSTAGRGRRVHLPFGLTPEQPLKLRVSEYHGQQGGQFRAGYFFIANGGWVSSAEGVRFLAFNLSDDYAYYLKVQVGSTDAGSTDELASLASSLLDDLLGELMACVPDWRRVERGQWPLDNPRGRSAAAAP